jgi:uncharacterized protein (DUF488 family)
MELYTIGHSRHSWEKYVQLLTQNKIQTVVDVRTTPYSRFNPQFNRKNLEVRLSEASIRYIFAGNHLGGRPDDPSCYKNGKMPTERVDYTLVVDYLAIMIKSWFVETINDLLEIASQSKTAIQCSEEDPGKCHRHHLISRYIQENFPAVEIWHIRGDGRVQGAR